MLISIYNVAWIDKDNTISNSTFSSLEEAKEFINNGEMLYSKIFTNYLEDWEIFYNTAKFFKESSTEDLIQYRNALLDAEMCLDKYLDDNKLYNFNHVKNDKDNSKDK